MKHTFDDEKYIAHLKKKISKLKKERDAVIIVHNYQKEEIQEIADITGDSLALSRAAIKSGSSIIVFCGVDFMAESAAILNPDKTVLLPVKEAGCPMADMVTVERLRSLKAEYPDAAVVCYVNSSALVKAESDICCTSSNAIEVVNSLKNYKRIIFIPDRNLASYVRSHVTDKEIIACEGFCPTHIRASEEEVRLRKAEHPDAEVVVHPECRPEVVHLADYVCSTGGMFNYIKSSPRKKFIIGTECGMLYGLRQQNPDKEFILLSNRLICPTMKLTTLGWIAHALEFNVHKIEVNHKVREGAKRALDRMLTITSEGRWTALAGY